MDLFIFTFEKYNIFSKIDFKIIYNLLFLHFKNNQ